MLRFWLTLGNLSSCQNHLFAFLFNTEEWEIVRGALPALYSSALLSGGPGTLAGGVTAYILYCGFCLVDTGRLSIGDAAKDDTMCIG